MIHPFPTVMKNILPKVICLTVLYTALPIGATGYVGCTKLQEITLPAGLTSIGDEAMLCCTALKKVTSANVTPPTCGSNVFAPEVVTYRTLLTTLQAGSAAYTSADTWYRFYDIRVAGNTSVNASASAGNNNINMSIASSGTATIPTTGFAAGLTYSLTFADAKGSITLSDATGSLKNISAGTTTTGSSFTDLSAGIYLLTVNNITIRIILYTHENK
jgi:hypothetical protein